MTGPLPCTTSACPRCVAAGRTWVGDRDAWHTDVTAARLWKGAGWGLLMLGPLEVGFGLVMPDRLAGWITSGSGVGQVLAAWLLIVAARRRLRRLGATR